MKPVGGAVEAEFRQVVAGMRSLTEAQRAEMMREFEEARRRELARQAEQRRRAQEGKERWGGT